MEGLFFRQWNAGFQPAQKRGSASCPIIAPAEKSVVDKCIAT
jgi:hypothetical protein